MIHGIRHGDYLDIDGKSYRVLSVKRRRWLGRRAWQLVLEDEPAHQD